MKLFHGTTYESYLDIMKNGFRDTTRVWHTSVGDHMYFYNPSYPAFEGDEDKAICDAFSSARITATTMKSASDRIIVLELDVPEEFVNPDISCNYMDEMASQVELRKLDLSMVTNVYECKFNPRISLLYIANFCMEKDTVLAFDLTREEKAFVEWMSHMDYYPDDLLDIDYWKLDEKELNYA